MFGAATNTNKYCTATGGPVLASGEHVTGGLVAAAARGLLAAHGWVGGPRGRLYQLFTHCFLKPCNRSRRCTRYQQSVLMRMMLAL